MKIPDPAMMATAVATNLPNPVFKATLAIKAAEETIFKYVTKKREYDGKWDPVVFPVLAPLYVLTDSKQEWIYVESHGCIASETGMYFVMYNLLHKDLSCENHFVEADDISVLQVNLATKQININVLSKL
ncbi:hypothetical protein WISP_123492 [Willisornis vidua]|uniref:Uncharacterized protein n=1 Tax=Willisornis vidua TaxID=1566151 RepID=A0ABQ9CS35_9PASS|nr:hypothetical protein WISP_123492 [Willisornis vidua]